MVKQLLKLIKNFYQLFIRTIKLKRVDMLCDKVIRQSKRIKKDYKKLDTLYREYYELYYPDMIANANYKPEKEPTIDE